MIEIKLNKKLKDFHLDIEFETDKKHIGILGPSGSGKSMTLKMISGIETPDRGEIIVQGKTLFSSERGVDLSPQERNLGFLFQDYAIFPHLSVRGNLEILGDSEEKIDKILGIFGLEKIQTQNAGKISGGEKQRLAMARIMMRENSALLFDEPFSALDYGLKQKLKFELMEQLKNFHGPYIMVSHSNVELYEFTDELIVLDQGKLILQDATEEVFHHPRKLKVAELLGVENIIPSESALGQKIPLTGDYFGIFERDIQVGEGDISWEVVIKDCMKNPFSYDYLTEDGIRFKAVDKFQPGQYVMIHVEERRVHSLAGKN